MTDETVNLVLEILKSIQADITGMKSRFARFEDQLNDFSAALLTLRIDMSSVRRDIQSAREEVLEAMRENRRTRTDIERLKAHIGLPDELHS